MSKQSEAKEKQGYNPKPVPRLPGGSGEGGENSGTKTAEGKFTHDVHERLGRTQNERDCNKSTRANI